MYKLLIIGLGGFFGSVSRYLSQEVVKRMFESSIPYGTMAVNILGSFLIGVVYALSEKENLLSPELRIFLAVGFCGGFTTFSSFAYENVNLAKEGQLISVLLYMALSIVLGFIAVYGGITTTKHLFVK